ncbi:MAG: ferric iron reductase [Clostridiales bacterium]|nr:ferric iron reductase [Clostridiales bacterium]
MKIEEYLINPIETYIKTERYINDGSPSGFSEQNKTSPETSPRSSILSFDIYSFELNEGVTVENIGAPHNFKIPNNIIYVHPDMISEPIWSKEYYHQCAGVEVSPTASGRTVLARGQTPFFIKLAYPKCLGRLIRHMGRDKILSACEVTKHLMQAVESRKTNPKFSFLREDYGRVAYIPAVSDMDQTYPLVNGFYEWGMLLREFKPYPYINENEFLLPFFALFGKEYIPGSLTSAAHQDLPLVLQLYQRQTQYKKLEEYLLQEVLFPLFDTYFDALLLAGIELEAHSQNMLISLDNNLRVSRIVCRDLESAGRDGTLMEYLHIPFQKLCPYKYNYLTDIEPDQKYPKWQITHSFMFDFKLGEYLVSPLLSCCKEYCDELNLSKIEEDIKEYNEHFISMLPKDFFPPEWCHYEKINFEKEGKKREYIWQKNPKYRRVRN